jgi:tetratricopeptide (TPR) repeat protein
MYNQALEELGEVTEDPYYAGQAQTQLALCLRALGRHEEAIAALRRALNTSSLSDQEYKHVLYLLGQSLESLGRSAEALEAYNWVRQEDAGFLDVQSRIKNLCGAQRSLWSQPLTSTDLFHAGRYLINRLGLRRT